MQEEIKQGTMKMDDAWTKFCTSLDKDSFHESLDIQNQMKTSNLAQMLPKSATKLAIFTADLYKDGFKQFPQMGEYDYAVEQLNII